ncbi:hypothetical protein WOLCODRAFT_162825 [Wolfiporia cocos MD-104 SS10]|uniref:Uncharacterized protein n=1 Tax=Wolfiporia cocos (strain MD-104) TaxID=742152 RepID=A0A2H3JML0_WOLCO|nr:hypothetical protein WOLCODRAFT_162825 [Wolfiporia cocos MD-104 SS10]
MSIKSIARYSVPATETTTEQTYRQPQAARRRKRGREVGRDARRRGRLRAAPPPASTLILMCGTIVNTNARTYPPVDILTITAGSTAGRTSADIDAQPHHRMNIPGVCRTTGSAYTGRACGGAGATVCLSATQQVSARCRQAWFAVPAPPSLCPSRRWIVDAPSRVAKCAQRSLWRTRGRVSSSYSEHTILGDGRGRVDFPACAGLPSRRGRDRAASRARRSIVKADRGSLAPLPRSGDAPLSALSAVAAVFGRIWQRTQADAPAQLWAIRRCPERDCRYQFEMRVGCLISERACCVVVSSASGAERYRMVRRRDEINQRVAS